MHTPLGHGTWEMGVQDVKLGNRRPWRIHHQEEGTWEVEASGMVRKTSVDEPEDPRERRKRQASDQQKPEVDEPSLEAPAEVDEPIAEAPEEPLEEPSEEPPAEPEEPSVEPPPEPFEESVADKPEECERPVTPPKRTKTPSKLAKGRTKPRSRGRGASPRTASPPPSKDPLTGLAIECWMKPGETDLQRLDRVMDVFLGKLLESGVVLPDNISRIGKCGQPEHDACYVYNFGTRRLHIATREGDAGRLTLVVRIGGGFIDFVEFVRRNGSLEKLRLERRPDSKGHEHIRLSSVMSHGRMQVREMPAANRTTTPTAANRTTTSRSVSAAPELPAPVLEQPGLEEEILSTFKYFDKKGDGVINPAELSQVLRELDPDTWTDEALRNLMQVVDTKDDGLISYEDFVAWSYSSDFQALRDAAANGTSG